MKKQHIYNNINGWFNFADIYGKMVKNAENGAHFVEIGTCFGKSASFMAVEIANSGKTITFDTIDTFKGSPSELHSTHKFFLSLDVYQIATYNLHELPVNVIKGNSVDVSKQYKNKSLDFVFIDGSHEYKDVKADIKAWSKKVKKGGYIGGHDYSDHEGVRKAVIEVFGECPAGETSWMYQLPL